VRARIARNLWLLAVLPMATTVCARQPVPTVEEGRMLYAENGCGSCHGAMGRGDGLIADTLDPKPTDFGDTEAFRYGFEPATIASVIANGMPADAPLPSNSAEAHPRHSQGMPPFPHLTEIERQSLALYVMVFRNESH
jgi:mono/diheme cytochrome c family protein